MLGDAPSLGNRGQKAPSLSSAPGPGKARSKPGAWKEPEELCQGWGPKQQSFDRTSPLAKPPLPPLDTCSRLCGGPPSLAARPVASPCRLHWPTPSLLLSKLLVLPTALALSRLPDLSQAASSKTEPPAPACLFLPLHKYPEDPTVCQALCVRGPRETVTALKGPEFPDEGRVLGRSAPRGALDRDVTDARVWASALPCALRPSLRGCALAPKCNLASSTLTEPLLFPRPDPRLPGSPARPSALCRWANRTVASDQILLPGLQR